MVIENILNAVIFIAVFSGMVLAILAMIFTFKMYGQQKPAPFILRATGFSLYMRKYLTGQGVQYRNKAFVCFILFIIFWFIGISVALYTDQDGFKRIKKDFQPYLTNRSNQDH